MAENILSRLSAGAKQGASEGTQGNQAGGIVGSIFRGAVGGMLAGTKTNKQKQSEADKLPDTAQELNAAVNTLVPFFANITENVQLIAHHIGASITSMKDIKEDSKQALTKAAVAQEEAATEDAVPAPPPPAEEQQDACQCDEQGNKKDKEKEGEEAGGFLKQFGGMDFEGIVGAFGATIGETLFDIGFQVITKLFPAGLIVSIVAAVGYGLYKYFTDDEFKKTVDDAFSSAKQFVVENVFDPFINGVKKLVTGAIEFLGNFWETVKGLVSKAFNYVTEKAAQAKEAVVSGAKAVSNKVSSFFGFGGEKKESEPAGQAPKSSAAPTRAPTPVAPTNESMPSGGGSSSTPPTPTAGSAPAPGGAPSTAATPAPTGPAGTGDASKLESVVNKASGVDLGGIVPALKARLAGFAADFQEMTGKKILITSGFRSPEKQKELYAKDPTHAAKPGVSPHEVGTAFDANSKSGDLDQAEKLGLFAKYKLFRPLWPPNRSSGVMEAWHVEPIERKSIASAGDGGVVAGTSGSAINPGDGKPTPVPPQPTGGKSISTASVKNAAINETRQKECGGTSTTLINAQQTIQTVVNYSPIMAGARRDDIPSFS